MPGRDVARSVSKPPRWASHQTRLGEPVLRVVGRTRTQRTRTQSRWASPYSESLGEPVLRVVGRTRTQSRWANPYYPYVPARRCACSARPLKVPAWHVPSARHLYSGRHFHSGLHATCTVACHLNSGCTTCHLYSGRHFHSGPLHFHSGCHFHSGPPTPNTRQPCLRQLGEGVTFLKTGCVRKKNHAKIMSCKTMYVMQKPCKITPAKTMQNHVMQTMQNHAMPKPCKTSPRRISSHDGSGFLPLGTACLLQCPLGTGCLLGTVPARHVLVPAWHCCASPHQSSPGCPT